MKKEKVIIVYAKKYFEDSIGFPDNMNFIKVITEKVGNSIEHDKIKQFIDLENNDNEFKKLLIYATENYSNDQVTVVMKSVLDLEVWNFYIIMSSYHVVSMLEDEKVVNQYKDMVAKYVDFETLND
jgi:hypothetical protein